MKRFSFPFLLRLRGSRPKTARVFNRLGIDGSVVSDFDFAAWRCANRRHRLGETRSADAPDFRSDKRRIASLPIGFGFFFIFVSFFFAFPLSFFFFLLMFIRLSTTAMDIYGSHGRPSIPYRPTVLGRPKTTKPRRSMAPFSFFFF